MYTLDQQIKDVDLALKELKNRQSKDYNLYLCNIAKSISTNFYEFIKRAFLRIEKISPKSYENSIVSVSMYKKNSGLPVWDESDYKSRKQFLQDLKEDIIENG